MQTHWYDKLWKHLETAADDRDQSAIDDLLKIRSYVADADTRQDMDKAESMFRSWEAGLWD